MLSQWLLEQGIGFARNGSFLSFPIDDKKPIREGREYGLTWEVVEAIKRTWLEWRRLAARALTQDRIKNLLLDLFRTGEKPGTWGDLERSELGDFLQSPCLDWFVSPQITRIDLAITEDGRLLILDPNVMPYGVTPMVAVSEQQGLCRHKKFLRRLQDFAGAWIVDRHNGGASSVRWLCEQTGLSFAYSDNGCDGYPKVIRQTRLKIRGREQTVCPPGMRIFESQIWPTLSQIEGFINLIPGGFDKALLRGNSTPSYLVKVAHDRLWIGQRIGQDCTIDWISFRTFQNMLWLTEVNRVFIKCLSSSGCHHVTFSPFRESQIVSAIRQKLFGSDGYVLLQPAQPCLINHERVRVEIFMGHDGSLFGAEVTRVPQKYLLAHAGTHAAISYLTV